MFNDFIGGGQVFLHKVRMFWQVFTKTIHIAFLVGIIAAGLVYTKDLRQLDWAAFYSYRKAVLADSFDVAMNKIRVSIGNKPNYITFIKVSNKTGVVANHADPRAIIKSYKFGKVNDAAMNLFQWILIWAGFITLAVFSVIVFVWSKFGKATKEKKHLSGHTIKTAKEVAQCLKHKKIASYFHLNGLPLVKDSETKHILVTGSTGSGKTNCLHTLLPQIRARKQPAVVVDTEGEMIARYYRPGYDILINPFDSRAFNWNLWDEIASSRDLKKVADSFFPDSPPDIHKGDDKWNEWGKMLFIGILEYMRAKDNPTIEELFNLIHKEPIESLVDKLKKTSVGTLLGSSTSNSNNAAPHNIRINTMLATSWLEFISEAHQKGFSFKEWFNALDNSKEDKWVFIASSGGDAKILLPFISTLADIAIGSLISLGVKEDRRIWFVFDELAKLKYLPTLQENISILRKYGGCILAATQSFNQLFAHYGKNTGGTMLSQFNTNIIFRITNAEEAKVIAKRIGEIEYLTHQKNTSYGAHEFRDGISYTEQEKKQDVVKVNDLSNLKPNQAFVLLPEPDVAISKVSLEIVKRPQNLQSSFLSNPSVDAMIESRNARWNEKLGG